MHNVTLVSESPLDDRASFRLNRLIEWAGFRREDFTYSSLENGGLPDVGTTKVIVPLGNIPTGVLIGRQGILTVRGYVYPGPGITHVIPTVDPLFIQRGQAKWSAAFIADIQKAVELAANGLPPQVVNYSLDPSPLAAYQWACEYRQYLPHHPGTRLAFDIETPGKGDDEDDTGDDLDDRTWHIYRIGFSYGPHMALSIPWEPAYFAAIRLLLGSPGEKIVWNAGFDVPRVRRAGFPAEGLIHDGMVAWHILHSDLPKRLGFVATFVCPWQSAWKHLSGAAPAYYNATDADVEWRAMDAIERELKQCGLWDVYVRDVVELDPVLSHMSAKGMPIDAGIREDRARKLADLQTDAALTMTNAVPMEARKIAHVYAKQPSITDGLFSRPGTREGTECPNCHLRNPRRDHFKRFVKKVNSCAGYEPCRGVFPVTEYYRLADFTPSRDQLTRYHHYLRRPLPMTWDKKAGKKKVSFGEKQIKELIIKYPHDILYPSILRYREIDKLAGCYVGRMKTPEGYGQNQRVNFWDHYDVINGCWIWRGGKNRKGQGVVRYNGKNCITSRVAWELTYGPTNGLWVLHKCDNPSCINPEHLFLGTAKDNMQDMIAKGRKVVRPKAIPTCHPERVHAGLGLCKACYHREYSRRRRAS